jgi:NAD(P)-dependent dehydrogenase (short-subunit alcohol dehydrogenase family)
LEEGARVVLCDVNQAMGEAAVAELGEGAEFYQVDVTDRQAVQAWVDGVVEKHGRVVTGL